jgi:hypothetical protein
MYRPLVPCPACHRHVRASDERCPFCAEPLPADLADRAVPGAKQRLSRAAAFVFGATVAVVGCSGEVVDGKSAGGSDDGASGTGGGSGTATGTGGAPEDDGGVAVLYGPAPPPDGGPDDDGGNGAKYGAPPMPDGGVAMDGGGGEPLYGAPPPPD